MEKKSAKEKSIYDNVKNHFSGNFPKSLPIESAQIEERYKEWKALIS